jgi:hypothetical protein
MIEIWKDIKNYEGLYQVSNYGRVKSLNHETKGKDGLTYRYKGRIRRVGTSQQSPNYIQYFYNLSKQGKTRTMQIHRLVAITFIPNPLNKREVNHIDGDTSNNHISNLEWMTPKENYEHAVNMHKLYSNEERSRRRANKNIPINLSRPIIMEYRKKGLSLRKIGHLVNLSHERVRQLILEGE